MKIKRAFGFVIAILVFGMPATDTQAASGREINAGVHETVQRFFDKVGGARELTQKAVGILVFPRS